MDIREIISIDNEVLCGQTVFKGTRVSVESLFDHLETGISLDSVPAGFSPHYTLLHNEHPVKPRRIKDQAL